MALNFDKYIGIHDDALLIRSRRAELMAANIANSDTPGYKAKDIDFKQAMVNAKDGIKAQESGVKLKTTHSNHIEGRQMVLSNDIQYRIPFQPSLDGNTVDSNLEKTEFAKNSTHYMASLRFLNGKFKSIKSALKGQ